MVPEPSLRQMLAEGRERWPDVAVTLDQLRSHCEKVLALENPDAACHGSDLYLACACVARIPQALVAYERETARAARGAIARIRPDDDFVEETLHALYDKLLFVPEAKIADYGGRGSLVAWTRIAAARTAIDALRARRLAWARREELSEELAKDEPALEARLTHAEYAASFQRALQHALATLSSQDRGLLRMHIVGRCSIDQIGRIHGVHRATAARWLQRARQQVLEAVRAEVGAERGALSDSEFLSIARGMGGHIEVTFGPESREASRRTSST